MEDRKYSILSEFIKEKFGATLSLSILNLEGAEKIFSADGSKINEVELMNLVYRSPIEEVSSILN